jgi:hypothetical protein
MQQNHPHDPALLLILTHRRAVLDGQVYLARYSELFIFRIKRDEKKAALKNSFRIRNMEAIRMHTTAAATGLYVALQSVIQYGCQALESICARYLTKKYVKRIRQVVIFLTGRYVL